MSEAVRQNLVGRCSWCAAWIHEGTGYTKGAISIACATCSQQRDGVLNDFRERFLRRNGSLGQAAQKCTTVPVPGGFVATFGPDPTFVPDDDDGIRGDATRSSAEIRGSGNAIAALAIVFLLAAALGVAFAAVSGLLS